MMLIVLEGFPCELPFEEKRELLLARIEDRHMHFMAKRGTDLGDLPEASVAQKSDFKHGIWTGLVFGGALGAVFGFVPQMEWALGLGAVLLFALLGASFGIWVSSMIASSVPNSELTGYDEALDAGKVLLMVDVPHGPRRGDQRPRGHAMRAGWVSRTTGGGCTGRSGSPGRMSGFTRR